jgi:hypothetical protein
MQAGSEPKQSFELVQNLKQEIFVLCGIIWLQQETLI